MRKFESPNRKTLTFDGDINDGKRHNLKGSQIFYILIMHISLLEFQIFIDSMRL